MVVLPAQKMNRRLWISLIAFVIVALFVLAAGWFYILKLSGEQSRQDTEAQSLALQNGVLSDIKLDIARLGDSKDIIYKVIPQTKDISDYLNEFETTVRNNGLTVSSTSVGDIQKKIKGGSELSQTVQKDQYYELPIRYEVAGDYGNMIKLISDIANGERLASVSGMSLVADYGDKLAPGKVKVGFTVTVYVKK